MTVLMIEGVDRIGKSTLSQYFIDDHGFRMVHMDKPEGNNSAERAYYQKGSYKMLFDMIKACGGSNRDSRILLDRAHLGELVYGPIYRGDSGLDLDYIFEMEDTVKSGPVGLILLVHNDLDVVKARDDGGGFDLDKMADEQAAFEEAFERSRLKKLRINVTSLDIPAVRKCAMEFASLLDFNLKLMRKA